MFKIFSKSLIVLLVAVMFVPFFSVQANESYFSYRSTEMGTGTHQTGQWEYEISNEKYDFSSNESIFALTRIFNITHVDTFQFKYEIKGGTNRDMFSPVYSPSGNWWAEIWYWDEFGTLPAGLYDLNVMISVDNGSFQYLDNKRFQVDSSSYYYDDASYDYYDYSNYNECGNPDYDFEWLRTGDDVRSTGGYSKEIINQSRNFSTTDNVHVLVKNSHISGIDTFRIKFDVYLNGDHYYKTNEVPTLNPDCTLWAYNYSWADLGRLPSGNHEIRTSIKLDNGAYRVLDVEHISVGIVSRDYYSSSNDDYYYSHSWTETDSNINFNGDYLYSVDSARNEFSSQDEVKVLTRLSDIDNIRSFKIRHELHKNGNYERKIESDNRTPRYDYWAYNYTQSNFGKLSAGSYEIKTYISVEGNAWRFLDSKLISVTGNSYTSDDYSFNYTYVDTDFDYNSSMYY